MKNYQKDTFGKNMLTTRFFGGGAGNREIKTFPWIIARVLLDGFLYCKYLILQDTLSKNLVGR